MHYVNADDLIKPDTRSPAEKWLDAELERRGALEQGAEPGIALRAIALELREQITHLQPPQGATMHTTQEPTQTSNTTPPKIGQYWPGQGGHYVGTAPAIGHLPARHIIASIEAPTKLTWGPYGTEVNGASSRIDGAANTAAILAHKAEHGGDFPAAEWAAAYTADGHTDFHLPSQADLFFMSLQPASVFSLAWHWSSTQFSGYLAFVQSFEFGYSSWDTKDYAYRVRAVRWIPL